MQNPLNEGADEWPSPPKGTGPPPTSPPKHDSIAFLMSLSPASRRRHQKRLYMRRKRASMSGVADIDESLERLKPGRKTKRPPSPKGDLDCVENEGGTTSACGADGLRMAQKRYSREKKMAFYELQGLGLASDNLRRSGLDILNPEGVAKMLRYVGCRLTSPTASLTQMLACGISCPETPLAMVQGSQSKPSSYSASMWSVLSKNWFIERSRSENKNGS